MTLVVAALVGATPARAADPFFSDDLSFVDSSPITMAPWSQTFVPFNITNTSSSTWLQGTGAADSVFPNTRVYNKQGSRIANRSQGGALGFDWNLGGSMAPGETRQIMLGIDTHYLKPGTYLVLADLIRGPTSSPTFFGTYGNPTPQRILIVQ